MALRRVFVVNEKKFKKRLARPFDLRIMRLLGQANNLTERHLLQQEVGESRFFNNEIKQSVWALVKIE